MRSLEQIIHDNGGDNTPMYDSHNLTGRATKDEGVSDWENEGGYAPLASIDEEIPFSVEVIHPPVPWLGPEYAAAHPEAAYLFGTGKPCTCGSKDGIHREGCDRLAPAI